MSDRKLPPVHDVFAYWRDNAVQVALHGEDYKDDCRTELTPMQALKLAEQLTRAAREALEDALKVPRSDAAYGVIRCIARDALKEKGHD